MAFLFLLALWSGAYEVGRVRLGPSGQSCVTSRNAWHYACQAKVNGVPAWLVDGKSMVEGADLFKEGLLNDDGSALLYARYVRDEQNKPGIQLEVNGNPVGKPLAGWESWAIGADGTVAAVVKAGSGYAVFTSQGQSPTYKSNPTGLAVTPGGAAVFMVESGDSWYLNIGQNAMKWGASGPQPMIWLSPDYKRVAGTTVDEKGQWMIVDNKRYGPYGTIGIDGAFSSDSQHFGWVMSKPGETEEDYAVVDGKEHKTGIRLYNMAVSPDGTPYYLCDKSKRVCTPDKKDATLHSVGVLHGEGRGKDQFIYFSPSGKHRVYFGKESEDQWVLVVDGAKRLLDRVTDVISAVRFGDDNEMRVIVKNGPKVELLCLSVTELAASKSQCLAAAKRMKGAAQ